MFSVEMCSVCGGIPAFEKDGRRYCWNHQLEGATPLVDSDSWELRDGVFYRPTIKDVNEFAESLRVCVNSYSWGVGDDLFDSCLAAVQSNDFWRQLRDVLREYWSDQEWITLEIEDYLMGFVDDGPEVFVGFNAADGSAEVLYDGLIDYWRGCSPSDYPVVINEFIPLPPEFDVLYHEAQTLENATADELQFVLKDDGWNSLWTDRSYYGDNLIIPPNRTKSGKLLVATTKQALTEFLQGR